MVVSLGPFEVHEATSLPLLRGQYTGASSAKHCPPEYVACTVRLEAPTRAHATIKLPVYS
jgi:hypothetical protein